MTNEFVVICEVCERHIPSKAIHYLTEHFQGFCATCAQRPANHTVIFPDCVAPGHTADDHAVFLGARLAVLNELYRRSVAAEEVAG